MEQVQEGRIIVKGHTGKETMLLFNRAVRVMSSLLLGALCVVVSPAGASIPNQDLSSLSTLQVLDSLRFREISPPSTLFRSRMAQNICVTIINHGTGITKVRLFRDQRNIGEFLVNPEKLSSICSQVNSVELQCTTGHCKASWRLKKMDFP